MLPGSAKDLSCSSRERGLARAAAARGHGEGGTAAPCLIGGSARWQPYSTLAVVPRAAWSTWQDSGHATDTAVRSSVGPIAASSGAVCTVGAHVDAVAVGCRAAPGRALGARGTERQADLVDRVGDAVAPRAAVGAEAARACAGRKTARCTVGRVRTRTATRELRAAARRAVAVELARRGARGGGSERTRVRAAAARAAGERTVQAERALGSARRGAVLRGHTRRGGSVGQQLAASAAAIGARHAEPGARSVRRGPYVDDARQSKAASGGIPAAYGSLDGALLSATGASAGATPCPRPCSARAGQAHAELRRAHEPSIARAISVAGAGFHARRAPGAATSPGGAALAPAACEQQEPEGNGRDPHRASLILIAATPWNARMSRAPMARNSSCFVRAMSRRAIHRGQRCIAFKRKSRSAASTCWMRASLLPFFANTPSKPSSENFCSICGSEV